MSETPLLEHGLYGTEGHPLRASRTLALLRPKILPKIGGIRGKDRNLLVRCVPVWIRSSRPSLVPFRIVCGGLLLPSAIGCS